MPSRVAALKTTTRRSNVRGKSIFRDEPDFSKYPACRLEKPPFSLHPRVVRRTIVITIPGRTNQREPLRPKWLKNNVARIGPTANPKFPPKRKSELAEAFFSPLNWFTILNPSG